MKRIHIRKPDIRGFFVKVRNLKKEDIKRHFREKKERRQRILEERRNSRFAKKMQPVYKWMNRLSLPLHFVLACLINFLIEVISRLSIFEAWGLYGGDAAGISVQCFFDIRDIFHCISCAEKDVCQNTSECFLAVSGNMQRISSHKEGYTV